MKLGRRYSEQQRSPITKIVYLYMPITNINILYTKGVEKQESNGGPSGRLLGTPI
jgi:hypothetical protein